MVDFSELREIGHDAIDEIGDSFTATFRQRTATASPLSLKSTETTSDTTVTCALFKFRKKDVDQGTLADAEDVTCYVSDKELNDAGITPAKDDLMIIDNTVFQIVFYQPNKPGNGTIWHKMRLRR